MLLMVRLFEVKVERIFPSSHVCLYLRESLATRLRNLCAIGSVLLTVFYSGYVPELSRHFHRISEVSASFCFDRCQHDFGTNFGGNQYHELSLSYYSAQLTYSPSSIVLNFFSTFLEQILCIICALAVSNFIL